MKRETLIATYNTKEEAQQGMHDMAQTLFRLKATENHAVYVRCSRGTWGVWLKERHTVSAESQADMDRDLRLLKEEDQ